MTDPLEDDGEQLEEEPPTDTGRTRIQGYHRLMIVLAIVIALLVIFQYAGLSTARRLGLIATPEPLTELYFIHPNALPSTLKPDERLAVTFAIVNREGSRRSYRWTADFIQNKTTALLASGSITLSDLGTRKILLSAPLTGMTGAGTVKITLVSPHQSIDFHVTITLSSSAHHPAKS